MKYFKTTLLSRHNKMETIRLLKSMIKTSDEKLFIFPFCMFSRTYYSYLKELKSKPFTGRVSNNDFEFLKVFHYGATKNQTSRNIKILGSMIEDNEGTYLKLEFHSPQWETVLEYAISISCFIAIFINKELLFLLTIPGLLIIEKIRVTLICYHRIKYSLIH